MLSVTLEIRPRMLLKGMFKSFSHVLSNPCEPVISSDFKMFKPQVTVTCQHGCSKEGQPQNVPNENIMFGVIKCLCQVITKFDGVIAGSSPNEKENAHSPNVPMLLLKVKSFMRSLQVKIYLEKSV